MFQERAAAGKNGLLFSLPCAFHSLFSLRLFIAIPIFGQAAPNPHHSVDLRWEIWFSCFRPAIEISLDLSSPGSAWFRADLVKFFFTDFEFSSTSLSIFKKE
jgi:hypothetical protein